MADWTDKRPKKCHIKHGAIYYVDRNQWTQVSRIDEGQSVFYEKLSAIIAPKPGSLSEVMQLYIKNKLPLKAKSTRREYKRIILNVLIPVFGHMQPTDAERTDVGAHLEHRFLQGKATMGNREMAVLGSIFQYAIRLGLCNYSPTIGVSRNTETPRTRYVEDDEFYENFDRAPVQLQHVIMATYLTSLRQGSLRALMINSAVTDNGLRANESKDGKRMIITWSPLLRQLVSDAKVRSKCEHLFTNSKGQRWRLSSIQSALTRWNAPFTFHDLRAKAESDSATGFNLLSRYKRLTVVEAVR